MKSLILFCIWCTLYLFSFKAVALSFDFYIKAIMCLSSWCYSLSILHKNSSPTNRDYFTSGGFFPFKVYLICKGIYITQLSNLVTCDYLPECYFICQGTLQWTVLFFPGVLSAALFSSDLFYVIPYAQRKTELSTLFVRTKYIFSELFQSLVQTIPLSL
jgi:cytochrome c oxidase subunit IV